METADRHRVLVADLSTERARLGETNVMRCGRHPAAVDAWLRGDEFAVLLVAQPNGLRHNATTTYGCGSRRDCRALGWVSHRRKERLFSRGSGSLFRRRL